MNIEFHTHHGEVKEWLLDHVRNELIKFHHEQPDISRAQVYLKINDHAKGEEKVCEIDIPIFGSSIFIHRAAPNFEEAIRLVLVELRTIVQQRIDSRNEPPDIITSSIDIEEVNEED